MYDYLFYLPISVRSVWAPQPGDQGSLCVVMIAKTMTEQPRGWFSIGLYGLIILFRVYFTWRRLRSRLKR